MRLKGYSFIVPSSASQFVTFLFIPCKVSAKSSYTYRVILGKTMAVQGRTDGGKFAQKSDEVRHVRSIRLTDSTWEALGAIATQRGITRADLLEELVKEGIVGSTQQLAKPDKETLEIEPLIDQVLADPLVTRNGKDKGAVRRGLEALLKLLN
jgi:predicted DNA-binding ribbon-helix-helix protein